MKADHNLEHKAWLKRKERIIQKFGTVSAAAAKLGCHPNSLRNIEACPSVKARLQEALA